MVTRGLMNEITTFICPRCQQVCSRMPYTGDYEHDCFGSEVLANEDVLVIGDWQDYTSQPIDNGLVGHWKMNDNAPNTTVVDSVGRNNGTAGTNTENIAVEGKINRALYFNGIEGSKITVPYSTELDITTNTITLMAWIYLDELPSNLGDQFEIIKHLRSTPTPGGYQMEINGTAGGGSTLRIVVRGPDDEFSSGTGTALSINTWYHCAVTYNGSHLRTYLNGVLELEDDSTGNLLSNPQDIIIGGQVSEGPTGLNLMRGRIDDVRIYNRVLNIDEINIIYNNGNGSEKSSPENTTKATNIVLQGIENTIQGNRARLEGNKNYSRTSRGFRTGVYRTRRHIEHIPAETFQSQGIPDTQPITSNKL